MKRIVYILIFLLVFPQGVFAAAPRAVDALPIKIGIKGHGVGTLAAYGATNSPAIFVVTDLSTDDGTPGDSTRSGVAVKTGSFKEAINYTPAENTGKVILFEVSGNIGTAGSSNMTTYFLNDNYVTIAGQSAPSPGVTIINSTFQVDASHIFIEHMRFRGAEEEITNGAIPFKIAPGAGESFSHVVLANCSISYGYDNNVSIGTNNSTATLSDVTLWRNLIYDGVKLYDDWNAKGGVFWNSSTDRPEKISLIENVFAQFYDRHPYASSGNKLHWSNNVIFNPDNLGMGLQTSGDPAATNACITGNVAIGGNMSGTAASKYWMYVISLYAGSQIYAVDNTCDSETNGDMAETQSAYNDLDWLYDPAYGSCGSGACDANFVESAPSGCVPSGYTPIASGGDPSANIVAPVLGNVGARSVERDTADNAIIASINSATGRSSIPTSMPSYPVLAENTRNLETGMGTWNVFPSDPHGDSDSDTYTNFEEWLHYLSGKNETPGTAPTISTLEHTTATYDNTDLESNVTDTLTWTEATVITGVPSYQYVCGSIPVTCTYSSGSGSAAHTYLCGPLTMDMHCSAWTLTSSELNLNGGSAQDTLGNAVTDLSLPAQTGVVTIDILPTGARGASF